MTELFKGSGPVGVLQASGVLRRLGRDFSFVFGDPNDKKLIEDVIKYAQVARLLKDLKNVKIGLLPYRCKVMTDIYVDEFSLMSQTGDL